MHSFFALATSFVLLVAPSLGVPASSATEAEPTSFIVKLKNNVHKDSHLTWLSGRLRSSSDLVTHSDWNSKFLNGFAGKFSSNTVKLLQTHPDVEYVEADGVVSINTAVVQTNAPWGIARLSQNPRLTDFNAADLTFKYTYDSSAGRGVDIYIIDTGIQVNHTQFGGRARWGIDITNTHQEDGNGHGTHVSGTAAGSQFGVAKNASLIAVKVLPDNGDGSFSDLVAGMNWVFSQAPLTGRPSIASMSLSGSASQAVDDAVASLTGAGIHVTVAAGNSGVDASGSSPARAPSANTIGATDIFDDRPFFSNFGPDVDLFAPGNSIISSWIGSTTTATNTLSGTSMSTPHVAGLIATLISAHGNLSPADMTTQLVSLCQKNAILGLLFLNGTPNLLARNDQ